MSRNIRTRDGNPFNFVDGIKLEGNDITINLQSYTALRTYNGKATTVRITTPGIAGVFNLDGLTLAANEDNGGTVICAAAIGSKRWKRVDDGPVYLAWFRVPVSPENGTAAFQNAIDAVNAIYVETGAPIDLVAPPAKAYLIDELNVKSGINLIGNNSVITPNGQTKGRLIGTNVQWLTVKGFTFRQVAGFNYMPVIELTGGGYIDIQENEFIGCGYAVRTIDTNFVTYRWNTLTQVGVCPRPFAAEIGWESMPGTTKPSTVPPGVDQATWDADWDAYNIRMKKFQRAYTRYGAGFRSEGLQPINGQDPVLAKKCRKIVFDDNYFENEAFSAGGDELVDGGAGAFTTEYCDNVVFDHGTAINAPGQGFLASGAWQGTDLPNDFITGNFKSNLRGKDIRFTSPYARGNLAEGVTAYGCGNVVYTSVNSHDNGRAALECWSCWGATINGANLTNDVAQGFSANDPNLFRKAGAAVNIVDSFDVSSSSINIKSTINSGVRIGGSYRVQISGGGIGDYGTSDINDPYFSSGISVAQGDKHLSVGTDITVTGMSFKRLSRVNNAGFDFFVGATNRTLNLSGNSAVGRSLTYSTGALASAQSETVYSAEERPLIFGNTLRRPVGDIRQMQTTNVSAIKPILSLSAYLNSGCNSFLCIVNGSDNNNLDRTFTDFLLIHSPRHNPRIIATATATVTDGMVDPAITITNPGTNYTTPPNILFVGGGGSGAQAIATLSDQNGVSGITVTNRGTGYTSAPLVIIDVAGVDGSVTVIASSGGAVNGSPPATRSYTLTETYLQLAMSNGIYSVRAVAITTFNGNIANQIV